MNEDAAKRGVVGLGLGDRMRQPLQLLRGTGNETLQGPSCIPGPQLPWVLNSSSLYLAPSMVLVTWSLLQPAQKSTGKEGAWTQRMRSFKRRPW